MKNADNGNAISPDAITRLRYEYLEAKRKLQEIENEYAALNNGRRYPGSPLVTNTSLADVARDFIVDEGHALTYQQIKAKFILARVQFDEGNLKTALKQAIKGPALVRKNCEDLLKKIEDNDLFDVK